MLRRTRLTIAGLAVASVIGAGAVAGTIVTASAHERFAKATLRTADGARVGTVAFERDRGSHHTEITVRLRHADTLEAFHGFHIHANDTSTNGNGCIADPTQPAPASVAAADRPGPSRPGAWADPSDAERVRGPPAHGPAARHCPARGPPKPFSARPLTPPRPRLYCHASISNV